jgi:Domain of unknown function (DUF4411)
VVYVFDTNSFRVLGNYYPKLFPSLWQLFDTAVSEGLVISVREVFNELDLQLTDGPLREWIDSHKSIFGSPTAEEADFVRQIFTVRHFQTLVGEKQRLKGQPVADPFLIAAAHARGGCVVSEEELRPNAAKIPNVCQHFGVQCTDLEGFMTRNGWRF